MTPEPRAAAPTMYPYFTYRDAAVARKWLAEAFSFEMSDYNLNVSQR